MTSFKHATQHTLMTGFVALCLTVLAGAAHAEAPKSAADSSAQQASGVVNINTATAEELDRLPGIGATRAQAIIELRSKVKRFENLDDLMRVKGIGRASLRKLRPMLTLQGATTLAAPSHTRSPRVTAPASAK